MPSPASAVAASPADLVPYLGRVIRGKPGPTRLAAIAMLSGGHLLLEDVPGVGKTVLARTLARAIDGSFARVQGAPDLLPTDITGAALPQGAEHRLVFVPGPVFANVVLVDELNRTTPRTQAALLEVMEERQVSIDGATHPLPDPHLVVATQNPVEQAGTYPLPESQLDRFTIATSMGYPDRTSERELVRAQLHGHPLTDLPPLIDAATLRRWQHTARELTVADAVIAYACDLCDATRHHPAIELGASPRATLQLVHAAQAWALLQGNDFVRPDDVKSVANGVLAHRLLLRDPDTDAEAIVRDLLRTVAIPTA